MVYVMCVMCESIWVQLVLNMLKKKKKRKEEKEEEEKLNRWAWLRLLPLG